MKKAKWQKPLKKSEIQHIKESTDSGTLAQFKRNREFHLKRIAAGEADPCIECRMIAIKLGLS